MDGFSIPEKMTESEYDVYNSFEDNWKERNNRKGFIGELAVDKALDELGLAFSTNPKESKENYNGTKERGPDHQIEGGIFIEDKNWSRYEITPEMYSGKIQSRFPNQRGRLNIVVMGNANFSVGAETEIMLDQPRLSLFVISLGRRISLSNFDECVSTIMKKISNYLMQVCPCILLPQFMKPIKSSISALLNKITGSSYTDTGKYTGYGPDPPPFNDEYWRTEADPSEDTIGLSEETTNVQKQRTSLIEDVKERITTLKNRLFSVKDKLIRMIISNEKMEDLDFWMEAEEKGKMWMILKHLWSSLIERVRGWRSDDEEEMYRECWDPRLNRYVRECLYCTECGARLMEAEIEEGKSMCYDCEMEAHTNLDYEEDEIVL